MVDDERDMFNERPSQQRKRRKAKSKQVFKPYQQHQAMLLPPSLEELIPEKHLVRVVNETIDKLNIEPLVATYKGDGTSAYHPLMLLKVLVYAYLTRTYASRMIAKALNENVHFMWLSGMSHPDFRTINTFRSSRLKEVIDQVFGSMVFFLLDHGYVDLQQYFVDGTKLRADSNKHKVVWAKNTKRYKEKVPERPAQPADGAGHRGAPAAGRTGGHASLKLPEHACGRGSAAQSGSSVCTSSASRSSDACQPR